MNALLCVNKSKQPTKPKAMKNKIQAIQKYFVQKIVSGDYKAVKVGSHHTDIIVDGEYPFRIWTANEAYGLELYGGGSNKGTCCNAVYITFTKEEQETIYNNLRADTCKERKAEAMERLAQAKKDVANINC